MTSEKKEKRRHYRGRSTIDMAYAVKVRKALEEEMNAFIDDVAKEAVAEFKKNTATAQDSKAGSWFIIALMKRMREKWRPKFEALAKQIAPDMFDRVDRRTDRQIAAKLKENGFSFEKKPSAIEKALIRIIAQELVEASVNAFSFLAENIQEAITTAYERGGDREYLTARIAKAKAWSKERAALEARDQINRATQRTAMANASAYGVTKGRWVHISGYYSSRASHIKMDGEVFDLTRGLYDPDVGRNVMPGELKYCNCIFEAVVPGFDE